MGETQSTEFTVSLLPIQRESLWAIAALQGDLTPLHWNDEAVRQLGAGDRPMAQGSMLVELIARAVRQSDVALSDSTFLQVRFRRPVFVGDQLEISGHRSHQEEAWDIKVINQEGDLVAEASSGPSHI
jgi:acyl dehydratase